MNFWKNQIRIRNQILEGERAAAAAHPAPLATPPVRDWFAVAAERAQKAEAERLERERKASDAEQARRQRLAQAAQDAQWAYGQRAHELRAAVVEAQQAVASCEARINGSDFDDAVRAAAELVVYQRRLESAQASYAQHAQRSPL